MSGFLGVLRLDTRFPRIDGDAGNPRSFAFPVRIETVPGAAPRRVVGAGRDDAALVDAFVAAGRRLAAQGALGLVTTCGFLALFQRELAARLPVPVATSALLQVGWLATMLPPRCPVGIVTIDAAALTPAHLAAVDAPLDAPIEGVDPDGALARTVLGDAPELDVAAAGREVAEAARRLVERRPEVGAVVLECANMPPYRALAARACGRPVHDALTLIEWFWRGLSPQPAGATTR